MADERRRKNNGVETVRIQFTLPVSLVDAIDEYCEAAHMQRSTYVEYMLASTLKSAADITGQLSQTLGNLVKGPEEE